MNKEKFVILHNLRIFLIVSTKSASEQLQEEYNCLVHGLPPVHLLRSRLDDRVQGNECRVTGTR